MSPRLRRLGLAAFVAIVAAAAWDAGQLIDEGAHNRAIAEAAPLPPGETRPQRLFAEAARVAAAGQTLQALALYRQLNAAAPPALAIAARYNSGNLHLREAIRLRQTGDATGMAQSLPLLELAKLAYREVLREQPQHWDARYNLERALRLAPEGVEDDDAAVAPLHADRAVPTLMGIPQGQP